MRLAPRRHYRSVPMLSMDARVRFTLRLPDGGWRCWGWIITTEAFFIFPRVTQKNPHSDRLRGPREVSSHDLGERMPQ